MSSGYIRNVDTSSAQARGFTLLEVLIATAILGTAVAALFSLLSGALANTRKMEPAAQALVYAQSKMSELLVQGLAEGPPQTTGPQLVLDQKVGGRFDDQFRWEAIATRSEEASQGVAGAPILVKVDLRVFWGSNGADAQAREKSVALETYQLWREPRGAAQ